MNDITITLPLPPKQLSPNARSRTWKAKAFAARRYRKTAYLSTLEACGNVRPRWERCMAWATFYHATNRRRDSDNAMSSLKAAFDGMRDAGLFVDDHAGVLTILPPVFELDADNPRVVVLVTKQEVQG